VILSLILIGLHLELESLEFKPEELKIELGNEDFYTAMFDQNRGIIDLLKEKFTAQRGHLER
jgi:hypothetical protein